MTHEYIVEMHYTSMQEDPDIVVSFPQPTEATITVTTTYVLTDPAQAGAFGKTVSKLAEGYAVTVKEA